MKKIVYSLVLAVAFGLFVMGAGKAFADDATHVAGTWELTSEGGQGGNTMTQTLTLQQDGASIKGTLTGRRGESPLEGSVDGNHLSFKVKRQNQNGETMVTEYTATVDGNSMHGKAHSQRGDREFKAKRTS